MTSTDTTSAPALEWLTAKEAARRAKCSPRMIYHAVKAGQLRAAKLGIRQDLRIYEPWLHAWLESLSTPVVINRNAPGVDPPDPGPLPFTKRGRRPEAK